MHCATHSHHKPPIRVSRQHDSLSWLSIRNMTTRLFDYCELMYRFSRSPVMLVPLPACHMQANSALQTEVSNS